jgi:hypothetical protein
MTESADRRKALAEYIETILEAHLADVNYAWWYRRATEPIASRNDRIEIMGDPCYYFDVLPVGVATSTGGDGRIRRSEASKIMRRSDRVRVEFWYQYTDDAAYASTSFALFELMIDSRDDTTPGVLFALEELRGLTTDGGDGFAVGIPESVEVDLIPLDSAGEEFAHNLRFELTLS